MESRLDVMSAFCASCVRPSPLVLPRVAIKYEKHKRCEQKNGQFFTGKFFGGENNAYYTSQSMQSESFIIPD